MLKVNDYWKEGRYFDLWLINHVLSGIVLGIVLFYFGLSLILSLIVALILFVGWEVAEILLGIKEHTPNMIMDVGCDFAGFAITSYFYFVLLKPFSLTTSLVFFILFIGFNLWGFIAYEKRHRLE